MTLRDIVKSSIEQGALWSGVARAMRARRRGDVLVLAYHNIVPAGLDARGDLSLHLPQQKFAAQLDALFQTHDIISLEHAVAGYAGERPAVAITFDDAYAGALTAGVAELSARALPATIFVSTAFVNGGDFWWDALTLPGANGPASELRTRVLDECAGENGCARAMAAREGLAAPIKPPAHARGASEGELSGAAAVQGITFGSHTHGHPNLTQLSGDPLRAELELSLAWLRERYSNVLPMLSYPYGLASPEVERAAANAGYAAGFRIGGGWMRPGGNAFALPRLNIPAGLSDAGFALRAAGILSR